MKTEILKKERHMESRALWEEVFEEDTTAFLDAYYAGKGAENEISVIRESACEGGEICAMIHWNPRAILFHGCFVQADFIVAVATKKDMRRRGLMARLMTEGLQKRAKAGVPFVFLTPADEAYYTPFQFVTVGTCMGCGLPLQKQDGADAVRQARSEAQSDAGRKAKRDAGSSAFAEAGIYKGSVSLQICVLPAEAYAFAAKWCNARLAARYAYFVKRDEAYFRQLAAELASENGKIMAVYDADDCGKLFGVFLYTYVNELELREPVYDMEDEAAVLDAVSVWAEQFKRQEKLTACRKTLPDAQPQSVTMVRITSLAACVQMLCSTETMAQDIAVRDPLISENNGCFHLSLSPDGCSLARIDAPEADCLPYTIEELTALIFQNGYLNEIV